MNALEIDAMTLHWEFAYGPAQVCKLAAGLTYPALAINIYDKVSDRLVFDPNCVIERGGLRIGIVGIASNIVDKSDQWVGQVHNPLDRATSLEASMDNVLLYAIAAAAGTRLAFSNGWRYGAPIPWSAPTRPTRTARWGASSNAAAG